MKKQIKSVPPHAGKLSLNKKTISTLKSSEMSNKIGGHSMLGYGCEGSYMCGPTKNGNSCPGHNTCYTC